MGCVISGFRREVAENCAFWVITKRVVVISYLRLRTTYRAPSLEFKNPKESMYSQYEVYVGKSVDGENVSGVWCQPIGLLQVVGQRVCGGQCRAGQ